MKVLNILIRRCVLIARFEETVSFYENLIAQKARLRFDYPEYDLKLAQVGSAWEKHLPSTGATIINPVKAVPTGWNMLVRHPDGMVAEYVEHHDKNPADEIF